jgi:Lamin Tail Domain
MRARIRLSGLSIAAALLFASFTALAAPAQAATPWVLVDAIYFNSPGSDTGSNASLNGEWIRLRNTTSKPVTITGWTLADKAGHVYTFPATTIKAKSTVTVKSGSGSNGISTRYWQQNWYVWNNTGDTAYVRNTSGKLVDRCSYTSSGRTVSTIC